MLFAIFIPILWQYAGFYILIYYAAFKNIPESMIEAAKIDGATPIQIALKIKLPLIKEVVIVTVVLAIVGSLKYFDLIYVMTGGGPNGASEVMASYMYKLAFSSYDFGYGSAIGFLLLIITLIVTVIIRKLTAQRASRSTIVGGVRIMRRFGYFYTVLCLQWLRYFKLFQLIWLFLFSLKDNREIFAGSPFALPSEFRWENYLKVWEGGIGTYFFNSVWITV